MSTVDVQNSFVYKNPLTIKMKTDHFSFDSFMFSLSIKYVDTHPSNFRTAIERLNNTRLSLS